MFAECFIMSDAGEATVPVQDIVGSISIFSTLLTNKQLGNMPQARGHKMAISH